MSKNLQDIATLAMMGMSLDEIEKEYGKVELVKNYEDVVNGMKQSGLSKEDGDGRMIIGNVFDNKFESYGKQVTDGFEVLKSIGVCDKKIEEVRLRV